MADNTNNGGAPGAAPATLDEALALITGLTSTNADLTGQVATLTDAATANGALIAQLQAGAASDATTIAQLQSQAVTASDDLDAAKETIAELKDQLAAAVEAAVEKSPFPSTTVDGVQYLVESGARGSFGNLDAADLAANEAACRIVLAINGQKILTPVTAKS